MKKLRISRLFHWLYASLMLAPIFAIGISCLTHVFNKEVEMPTQSVEINYKYETIDNSYVLDEEHEITSYDGYIIGKYVRLGNVLDFADIFFKSGKICLNDNTYYVFDLVDSDSYIYLNVFYNGTIDYFQFYNDDTEDYFDLFSDYFTIDQVKYIDYLVYHEGYPYNHSTSGFLTLNPVPIEDIPIQTVNITENELPNTNIFYYSVDKAMNSSYFSWASDSFLVEPFKYLGNLFNVPSDNPIYLLLSYWLDISIIWLVFDLVMYVPMLVHSWIDKSAIGG